MTTIGAPAAQAGARPAATSASAARVAPPRPGAAPSHAVPQYPAAPELVAPAVALLAISRGTADPRGRAAVTGLVDAVRAELPGAAVTDGFVGVQQPNVRATLAAATGDAVVVPIFVLAPDISRILAAGGADELGTHEVRVTNALGPDPRIAAVVERRLAEVSWNPDRDAVVLAVAGASDATVDQGLAIGSFVADALGARVDVGSMAGAGDVLTDAVASTRAAHPDRRVIVASCLLAPGYYQSLARQSGADVTTRPLLVPDEPAAPELVAIVRDRYFGALAPRR